MPSKNTVADKAEAEEVARTGTGKNGPSAAAAQTVRVFIS